MQVPSLIFSRRNIRWAMFAVTPFLLNLAVWKLGLVPATEKLNALQEVESIGRMKPKWVSLHQQSDRLLERSSFTREDAAAAVKEIQKRAGMCGAQIDEISKKNLQTDGSLLVVMPVEAKVTGSYKKLVEWIGAIENIPGLQIDSWAFPKPTENGRDRLDISIRVILRNP